MLEYIENGLVGLLNKLDFKLAFEIRSDSSRINYIYDQNNRFCNLLSETLGNDAIVIRDILNKIAINSNVSIQSIRGRLICGLNILHHCYANLSDDTAYNIFKDNLGSSNYMKSVLEDINKSIENKHNAVKDNDKKLTNTQEELLRIANILYDYIDAIRRNGIGNNVGILIKQFQLLLDKEKGISKEQCKLFFGMIVPKILVDSNMFNENKLEYNQKVLEIIIEETSGMCDTQKLADEFIKLLKANNIELCDEKQNVVLSQLLFTIGTAINNKDMQEEAREILKRMGIESAKFKASPDVLVVSKETGKRNYKPSL